MRETKVWFGVILMVVVSSVFANNANASTKNNLLKQSALQQSATAHKAVFLISSAQTLKKYENAPVLSDKDLFIVLKAVGLLAKLLKQLGQ